MTTDLVIRRIGSSEAQDPFLILATQGIEPDAALSRYAERWSIETLFAALKSRGFDLEATRLTAPERVERLMALLALAFLWACLVGERRGQVEGHPAGCRMDGGTEASSAMVSTVCSTYSPRQRSRTARFCDVCSFFEVPLRFCHVLRVVSPRM